MKKTYHVKFGIKFIKITLVFLLEDFAEAPDWIILINVSSTFPQMDFARASYCVISLKTSRVSLNILRTPPQ